MRAEQHVPGNMVQLYMYIHNEILTLFLMKEFVFLEKDRN